MPRAACHGGQLGAGTIAAVGFRRICGAHEDHRRRCIAARRKPGGVTAHRTGLLRIHRRRLRPAALDIAERIGAHAGRFAAFRRESGLDQTGKTVAERARTRKLDIAMGVHFADSRH